MKTFELYYRDRWLATVLRVVDEDAALEEALAICKENGMTTELCFDSGELWVKELA